MRWQCNKSKHLKRSKRRGKKNAEKYGGHKTNGNSRTKARDDRAYRREVKYSPGSDYDTDFIGGSY